MLKVKDIMLANTIVYWYWLDASPGKTRLYSFVYDRDTTFPNKEDLLEMKNLRYIGAYQNGEFHYVEE